MNKLKFISDEQLQEIVDNILYKAVEYQKKAKTHFDKNVIDPFTAIFEIAGFSIDEKQWRKNEEIRKAQKSLSGLIGKFHENILSSVEDWYVPSNIADLCSTKRKIIAEVKNKHNTVKGSDLPRIYDTLAKMIEPKNSIYKGYTAYYVCIIPKTAKRYDEPFSPSDNNTGSRMKVNEKIRKIDGYSFYELVCGEKDALSKLFDVLPEIINQSKHKNILKTTLSKNGELKEIFDQAYRSKKQS